MTPDINIDWAAEIEAALDRGFWSELYSDGTPEGDAAGSVTVDDALKHLTDAQRSNQFPALLCGDADADRELIEAVADSCLQSATEAIAARTIEQETDSRFTQMDADAAEFKRWSEAVQSIIMNRFDVDRDAWERSRHGSLYAMLYRCTCGECDTDSPCASITVRIASHAQKRGGGWNEAVGERMGSAEVSFDWSRGAAVPTPGEVAERIDAAF